MLYYNCIEIMQLLDSKWSMIFASYHLMKSHWKWVQTLHSRLREKSSQTKYQKNYPSKSKASFQYLCMRKVHEKILRVCFLKSLGDFGPQNLLTSPNSQFFIKQHREVLFVCLFVTEATRLWVKTGSERGSYANPLCLTTAVTAGSFVAPVLDVFLTPLHGSCWRVNM